MYDLVSFRVIVVTGCMCCLFLCILRCGGGLSIFSLGIVGLGWPLDDSSCFSVEVR